MELVYEADCLDWMRARPDNSVDLVIGSGPYEAARTYGVGFKLRGQPFVDWLVERMVEMVRVSRGLVAMVIEGQTRQFRWSATPALLMADLHRRGVHLRKPPAFCRVGIPGSGGPDWWRNDYEFIVCCSKGGKLPWSDNTATGHPPKWAPGGAMANRLTDGTRVNQWGGHDKSGRHRKVNGERRERGDRPSHRFVQTLPREGMHNQGSPYSEPVKANPGNRIEAPSRIAELEELLAVLKADAASDEAERSEILKCIVGGGVMGSKLAHENEAPFPESLADAFVRSFCPPGGFVLDPFCGSGTTAAVCIKTGRHFLGCDVRESQVALTRRRIDEARQLVKQKGKP